MRKFLIPALTLVMFAFPVVAADGLDVFLKNVNVQARSDMDGFSVKVSAQFGVPESQVRVVLRKVNEPADAFMIFELGRMSKKSVEIVLQTYESRKGRGWGALAKELGIKPGSAEFHALKRGDLYFGGERGERPSSGKGKGKGKAG